MSEKRFLGWEPTETHVHEYDDRGRLVRTVVARDPEWDDVERAKMLGRAEYYASMCECGLPRHIADEDPDLQVTERVCPVCAGLAQISRIHAKADEQVLDRLGKNPAPETPRPGDGRHRGLKSKPAPADPSSPGDPDEP